MARSEAATVREYLETLTPERREVMAAVHDVIARNLPDGYEESMNWGMIAWELPLSVYADTYNGHPLGYAALAAQKNHYALYLFNVYMGGKQATELRQGFDRAGRKLDMGKSCIRFRALDDLPLDVIGRIVASTPPAEFIRMYESARSGSAAGAKKSAAGTRSAGGSKKSEAGQRASRKR